MKLTIGQLAKIFSINIQTLYYYDSIGLFKPASRDEVTGIRKYEYSQMHSLANILHLRKLGFNTKEIKEQIGSFNPKEARSLYKERSKKLKEQYESLIEIDNAIQRRLRYIEACENELNTTPESIIIYRPKRYYVPMGERDEMHKHKNFYFQPIVGFYEEEGATFGAYLEDFDVRYTNAEVKEIEEGYYFVTYHRGYFESIRDHWKEILDSKDDLDFSSSLLTFNIYDHTVESDAVKFLTRLEIKLNSYSI